MFPASSCRAERGVIQHEACPVLHLLIFILSAPSCSCQCTPSSAHDVHNGFLDDHLREQVLLPSVKALCRVPGASRSGLTRPSIVGPLEEKDARLSKGAASGTASAKETVNFPPACIGASHISRWKTTAGCCFKPEIMIAISHWMAMWRHCNIIALEYKII